MIERTILFSGPMVRAILDGRKTQTRRIVKPQWSADVDEVSERPALDPFLKCVVSGHSGEWEDDHGLDERRRCPYGQPGDRLWVKETFFPAHQHRHEPKFAAVVPDYIYAADYAYRLDVVRPHRWKPSIFCTRAASRITLEVTAVRVERLQEISEEDAIAEGVEPYVPRETGTLKGHDQELPSEAFRTLWESINGPGSWAANPWVWVVEFRRVEEGVK